MDYAISDIHGCNKTFQTLLDKIGFSLTDKLFLLGDYIDRGPDSKGVIDTILDLQEKGYDITTLLGNHEDMLLNAYTSHLLGDKDFYLGNGGRETLKSFDVKYIQEIPDKYIAFMENLELYAETEAYYLVHAGFNFGGKTIFENEADMLWIRHWYSQIVPEMLHGKTIVHGHTPIPLETIQKNLSIMLYPAINIDAGCFAKREGYGYLCALNLTHRELIVQQRVDY